MHPKQSFRPIHSSMWLQFNFGLFIVENYAPFRFRLTIPFNFNSPPDIVVSGISLQRITFLSSTLQCTKVHESNNCNQRQSLCCFGIPTNTLIHVGVDKLIYIIQYRSLKFIWINWRWIKLRIKNWNFLFH